VNLWQSAGPPATAQEIVLDRFTFVPADSVVVAAPEVNPESRSGVTLFGARPNPFQPPVTIRYALVRGARAEVVVHDVAGRRIRVLADGFSPAGTHEVVWDGRDAEGSPVTTGIYFCRLRVGDTTETRRLVLLR
jgi:hypothetical protein